jgi:TolA-binding protein
MLGLHRLWAGAPPADSVIDLDAVPGSSAPQDWGDLEPKLAGPGAMEALDAYLSKHPHGVAASRAQLERARRIENLDEGVEAYKAAISEDPGGPWSRLATLELGKQEYALGQAEAALTLLAGISEEDLQGDARAQLMFWRAQCRLVLKGMQRAQDDFEGFLRLYPDHSLADAARLGVADCDAQLGNDEAALKGYQKLFQEPASSVAPQALLEAAGLLFKGGRQDEARQLLSQLASAYPDSLEAERARALLKSSPPPVQPPLAAPPKEGAFTIQVGAYVRHIGAVALFNKLRRKGYAVSIEKRVLNDNILHMVQVGRYPSKILAQKAAMAIKAKEHLQFVIVPATSKP